MNEGLRKYTLLNRHIVSEIIAVYRLTDSKNKKNKILLLIGQEGPVHISLKPNSISNPKLIFSIISYMGLKDSHHFKSYSSGHIRS